MMNQKHVSELIDEYIDGTLDDRQKSLVELHLNECPACLTEYEEIRKLVASLKKIPVGVKVPRGLSEKIETSLSRERKKLSIANLNDGRNKGKMDPPVESNRGFIYRVAAMLLIGLVGSVIFWVSSRDDDSVPNTTSDGKELIEPAPLVVEKTEEMDSVGAERGTREEPVRSVKPRVNPVTTTVKPSTRETFAGTRSPVDSVPTAESGPVKPVLSLARGSIAGSITDSLTGEPIIGGNVFIVGTGRGAATDVNGRFRVDGVTPGTYTAKVTYIGYPAKEVDVIVEADAVAHLSMGLRGDDISIPFVTVTAEPPIVERSATTTMSMTRAYKEPGAVAAGHYFLYGERQNELSGGLNTEQYDHLADNEFKEALGNPLSTFSIDVDNASYSNIRRFINGGQLPPAGAVRIEEMINYFTYDYPQPKDGHPFSVTMELAPCPWNSDNQLMLIGLQGKRVATEDLPPSNLVFLIDVSGSMQPENKLPLVKRSFRLLVDQLRPIDRVAIAVYAGNAGLVLPSTSGRDKQTILNAIDQLESGGSTAGGAGINLAYSVARENFLEEGNNRVILATDGDFNVGVTNDDGLVRLIEEKREDGIFLSVLGFGMGNVKDSRMKKLADKGNGNYAYIDNLHEAKKVFVGQMAGTLHTVAKDVKLQIEFNPANVKAYRLVGYENRILNKEDFNDDRKDAGDMGAGHSVTALYEIVPADGDIELPAVDSLKYSRFGLKNDAASTRELATVKLRYKLPSESTSKLLSHPILNEAVPLASTSGNFRFAAAVAEFGMLLRDSKFKGNASFDHVLETAKRAKGEDEEGYRAEFIRLVEMCRLLPQR